MRDDGARIPCRRRDILLSALIIGAGCLRQHENFKHRNDPDHGWSSPVPFVGPVLLIAGYVRLHLPFSPWLFLIFLLDPDMIATILSLPYLIKGFRE